MKGKVNMTSIWKNIEQSEKIVGKKEQHETSMQALILCEDLTSVIMANKPKPAVAAQAIAMMFGVAYRIACNHKMDNTEDNEIFIQMSKIAHLMGIEYEDWICQAEKAETKGDAEN